MITHIIMISILVMSFMFVQGEHLEDHRNFKDDEYEF